MSVLRRAWRVLTDPSASTAAACLRFLVLFEALWGTAHLLPVWPFTVLGGMPWSYFALYFVSLCAALWFVRQRDEARAHPRDEVLQTSRPDRPNGW